VQELNQGVDANISQSASPSSTLPPALLTPVSSTGYPEGSSASMAYPNDHHGINSPRSISGSTTSTVYNPMNIPARVLSPHDQKSMAPHGGPPDLRVAVSHNPHEPASHWQGGAQHQLQGSQQYQHLHSQSGRSSWGDMYLEGSPATSAGTSGPTHSLAYPNSRNMAEAAVAGGDNRIVRSLSSQQQSQQVPRT
jgi:hypothetical protein